LPNNRRFLYGSVDRNQKRTLIARIIKQLPPNSIRNPEAVLMDMTMSGLNNLDVALTLLGRNEEIAAADGPLAARLPRDRDKKASVCTRGSLSQERR
jgi:hypothetical protein